jgi:hypothetical protein
MSYPCGLEVKVTKINKRWHSRLLKNSKVLDEMACELQEDIGWICREMLRWHQKLGGISKFADVGRHKQKCNHKGTVWYKIKLDEEKLINKARH